MDVKELFELVKDLEKLENMLDVCTTEEKEAFRRIQLETIRQLKIAVKNYEEVAKCQE